MAFHGRVALVTGAASGMGRIEARRLEKIGAQVAALDLNEAGLEETAEGWAGIHPYCCDVADAAAVKEVVAGVENDLGSIDRVTHAAAIMPTSRLVDADPEWIKRLMRVNYEGTVNVTMATLPAMLRRGSGDLIIYGSLAGHVLAPHLGAYSASKAAVNAFAEILIRENAGSGVRILLVCPDRSSWASSRGAWPTRRRSWMPSSAPSSGAKRSCFPTASRRSCLRCAALPRSCCGG
jgi:NADP-dependent 3-hydroxy acid dehydrogenase YdfG